MTRATYKRKHLFWGSQCLIEPMTITVRTTAEGRQAWNWSSS